MPKQVGRVEMYRLFKCPEEGCNPCLEAPTEECVRHTKEETDAMLSQLREDLAKGHHVVLRCGQGTLSMQINGVGWLKPSGRISVSGNEAFIHVEWFQPAEHLRPEYDLSLNDVFSVEIDSIDMWDEDHHPVVYWRHEIDFCDSSRFFRCDYCGEKKLKEDERLDGGNGSVVN